MSQTLEFAQGKRENSFNGSWADVPHGRFRTCWKFGVFAKVSFATENRTNIVASSFWENCG